MRPLHLFLLLASLAACSSGNVRSVNEFQAPPAPPVIHPDYDPYAPYGQANATWRPPVFDRRGTIVKPDLNSERPIFRGRSLKSFGFLT